MNEQSEHLPHFHPVGFVFCALIIVWYV